MGSFLRRPVLAALLAVPWLVAAPGPVAAQTVCRFVLGFADLREQLGPAVAGACWEDEHFNPANGNAEQRTSGGLLAWRKVDNWTAFTDGYRTWVNGPNGLQVRLNAERFPWETDPVTGLPGTGGVTVPTNAQAAVDAALDDAAPRLGVNRAALVVTRLAAQEWTTSALGCPQPGFFYLQVITPGYLVSISGAGRQLEYHTDTRGRAVYCGG